MQELSLAVSSASHLRFTLLFSLDLGLDRLPVDLNLLAKLDKSLIRFLFVVLLEEAFAISDDSVDVGLLANGNIEGSIPAVKLDVHLNGAVVEASAHKDLLSLIALLAVKREGSVAGGLARQFLNIIDVLDFISLINYSESNLKGIQLAAVDSHGGKARPKSLFLDEATKADSFLEIRLFHMLVQNSWIGRDCKSGETTIKPAHFAEVTSEADHLRELSNFGGFADSARFLHKVLVHINGIRVEPCNVLAVADAAEHIV